MKENQLEDYCLFLDKLNQKLDKFFEQQKPYIYCKEGCAYCCQEGEYPCTELEFSLLKIGFDRIEDDIKEIVIEKTKKLKEEKSKNPDKVLTCECPFLVDNKCSAYIFRPIICRTFGIAYFDMNDKLKVPFCHELGLNYSNVYDTETKMISDEKYKATGIKQKPLAYNLSQSFLIKEVGENGMGLDFGEQKTITDWMIETIE